MHFSFMVELFLEVSFEKTVLNLETKLLLSENSELFRQGIGENK